MTRSTKPAIPHQVHLIWLGGPPPADYLANVDAFTVLNPDWHIRWWHEDDIEAFGLLNADLYAAAPDLVPADSVHQLRSDIARYEILQRHGGLYIDLDYRWFRPITPVLARHRLVTCWEKQNVWVANGFIAAAPHHRAMTQATYAVRDAITARRPGNRANRLSGPHVWTPIARTHAHILDQRTLHAVPWNRPYDADILDPDPHPEAIGVHCWGHQRLLREMAS